MTMDFTFDTTLLSENEYVGFTGDVEIYTFSYVDRSIDDGTVVGNGTFRAIKCVGRTLVDIFELYYLQKTDGVCDMKPENRMDF